MYHYTAPTWAQRKRKMAKDQVEILRLKGRIAQLQIKANGLESMLVDTLEELEIYYEMQENLNRRLVCERPDLLDKVEEWQTS